VGEAGHLDTELDHTSLLKLLVDKWDLGSLGARTAVANTPPDDIFLGKARRDTPEEISAAPTTPPTVVRVPRQDELSDNQAAMVALSHAFEEHAGEAPEVVVARMRHSLTGPQAQADAALERLDAMHATVLGGSPF